MEYKKVVDFIRKTSKEENLSMYEVAKRSDCTEGSVQRLFKMKNEARFSTLNKVLGVFGFELIIKKKDS